MSYPWGQPDQPFVAETTHLSPQFPTHIEGTPAFAGGIFVPDAFNLPAPAVTWDPSYVAHGLHPSMPQPMLPTSALGGAGGFIPSAPMFQSAHDAYPQQFVAVQGCSSVDEEERRKEARRETQRRYFRRKKAKLAGTEQQVAELKAQTDEAKREFEMLSTHTQTLQNLQTYKDSVISWLKTVTGFDNNTSSNPSAGTATATNENTTSVNADVSDVDNEPSTSGTTQQHSEDSLNNIFQIPSPVFENVISITPTDFQIRFFVRNISFETLLLHREKGFLTMRDLLRQWQVANSDALRARISRKLDRHMDLRVRFLSIIRSERPEFVQNFLKTALLPGGSQDDPVPGVNPMLYPLLTEIQLTPEQDTKCRAVWADYKLSVASARQKCRFVQHHLSSYTPDRPESLRTGSMAKYAHEYLAVLQGAALMSGYSQHEAENATNLWAHVYDIFDSIQHTMATTRCYPFFPDPVQLLELLLGGHETSPAVLDAINTATVVDSCHLIAESRFAFTDVDDTRAVV